MALNILIVDDSATTRAIIAKTLDMAQIPVGHLGEAANGAEALEILDKEWFDLVFTDLHMPVMNGIELVRQMRARDLLSSTPVVVVTSEGGQERIDQLMEWGVRAYVRKPFTPEQMTAVIHDMVGEKI